MQPTQVRIPDILRNWPCSRHVNPHYAEVKKESDAWIEGLQPFDSPKHLKAYLRCDFRTSISAYLLLFLGTMNS